MLHNRSIVRNFSGKKSNSFIPIQEDLPLSVQMMRDIPISGNVVPMAWFKSLVFANGKPDLIGIFILSDIVYWYRPTEMRDERSGAVVGYKKKFSEDLLRRSYSDLESQFGISKKQCQESLRRLEERGLITRVFRTLETSSGRQSNVMYIALHPERLMYVTQHVSSDTPKKAEEGACPDHSSKDVHSDATPYGDQIPYLRDKNTAPVKGNHHTYGDQVPYLWKSNSTPMEFKLHRCGIQAPDHIRIRLHQRLLSLLERGLEPIQRLWWIQVFLRERFLHKCLGYGMR